MDIATRARKFEREVVRKFSKETNGIKYEAMKVPVGASFLGPGKMVAKKLFPDILVTEIIHDLVKAFFIECKYTEGNRPFSVKGWARAERTRHQYESMFKINRFGLLITRQKLGFADYKDVVYTLLRDKQDQFEHEKKLKHSAWFELGFDDVRIFE